MSSKSVAILYQNYTDPDVVIASSVSSEDAGYPITNLYDETKRAKVWRSTSTSAWIKWDFGVASNPKAFVLTASRNFPLKISSSAVVKLQANETDVWTGPSFEKVITYHDKNLIAFDWDGLATTGYRYWRLTIDDPTNIYGYIEAGLVYLGDAYTTERGAPQFPLQVDNLDRSNVVQTESGAVFVGQRSKAQRFNLNWSAMTASDVESFDEIFAKFGLSKAFFVAFDPAGVWSTSPAEMVRWCRFEKEPTWSLESPGFFSMNTTFREEV